MGESAEDATRCGDWRYRDGFAVVSLRAQEKTPGSRISLLRGFSGVKLTLFEKETETFRKRFILSEPEGDVPARSSESDHRQGHCFRVT